ncbi:alpha/beta hydrolase [Aliikangiella marina]|uniref:Alpha/beta hydrolase n=1 Tax=Aliikangiella marina TaxID=1712262 RepID=A0A545T923_9GAMM|nr:alpha/beta hydrolase [Aliikangiella marina]TQV73685.1 alpha/beta hydrolase [Aliikangiella marina]
MNTPPKTSKSRQNTPIFDLNKIAFENKTHQNKSHLPPFVFIHGNSQNTSCGRDLFDYFYHRGHDVIAYDLPGHGDSPMQAEDYHFNDLVTLNQQIITSLDLNKPILCGHSLGGMIQAATIVDKNLSASSLIFCGSYDASPVQAALAQSQNAEAQQIFSSLDQYIAEAFKLYKGPKKYDFFSNLSLEDELIAIFNRRYTHPIANQINLTTLKDYNVRSQLAEKQLPILVLHGQEEDIIPAALVKVMQPAYDTMEVEWYPDGGHFAFYQQPQLTRDFLDKHYDFLQS